MADSSQTNPMTEIRERELPAAVSNLVSEYNEKIGHRNPFIWKWLDTVFPAIRLSTVPRHAYKDVQTCKLILGIYMTVADDFNDVRNDQVMFNAAASMPREANAMDYTASRVDPELLNFVQSVWNELEKRLREAPRYDEFSKAFRFDVKQALNATEYADVVNDTLEIASYRGSVRNESPTMIVHPLGLIDVMFSPEFDECELSDLRKLFTEAQPMIRIGNWVTTWERELDEGDYSSGVFATALDQGIITPEELEAARTGDENVKAYVREQIEETGVEEVLFEDWSERFQTAKARQWQINSVDVDAYLDGVATIFQYHQASRGLK